LTEETKMAEFHVTPGQEVEFSKTVGESDVYMFAGITGDLAPNHVNEQVMSRSKYKHRIAHGALMVGYMSTASSKMIEVHVRPSETETAVSLGYDKIRFLGAVFLGDTVTVRYRIKDIDPVRRRSRAEISVVNQHGDLVAVGEHIMKWVANDAA
jgi:3-hydroxybutyryl-CoA dehydratase